MGAWDKIRGVPDFPPTPVEEPETEEVRISRSLFHQI